MAPIHKGVDPAIQPYVDSYMKLAKDHGIVFKNRGTAGFAVIGHGATIGVTYTAPGFREIDLDIGYWNRAGAIERTVLTYHELTHLYCDRGHDYWPGKPYGKEDGGRNDPDKKDGFFSDSCPISLMFPYVIPRECMLVHYSQYVDELFKNCNPY
jgi:hypothetical protein